MAKHICVFDCLLLCCLRKIKFTYHQFCELLQSVGILIFGVHYLSRDCGRYQKAHYGSLYLPQMHSYQNQLVYCWPCQWFLMIFTYKYRMHKMVDYRCMGILYCDFTMSKIVSCVASCVETIPLLRAPLAHCVARRVLCGCSLKLSRTQTFFPCSSFFFSLQRTHSFICVSFSWLCPSLSEMQTRAIFLVCLRFIRARLAFYQ